jgi:hypothetical protein
MKKNKEKRQQSAINRIYDQLSDVRKNLEMDQRRLRLYKPNSCDFVAVESRIALYSTWEKEIINRIEILTNKMKGIAK